MSHNNTWEYNEGMNETYTLAEIKEELFREIDELEERDSSWKRCGHCPNHGKCCIDNDIDVREDEWEIIKAFLDRNEMERNRVKENLLSGRKCYFRTPEKCLIHKIRPTNCIYTPYQVIQNLFDHHIIYSLIDEECNFTEVEKPYKKLVPSKKFLTPETGGHVYLLLNYWYLNFESKSKKNDKKLAEERLKEYFGI